MAIDAVYLDTSVSRAQTRASMDELLGTIGENIIALDDTDEDAEEE